MPRRLTLLAHAPTRAQRDAAFPLDEDAEAGGLAQVMALGTALASTVWRRVDRLWTAPEQRTRQTAAALADAGVGLVGNIQVVPDVRDLDHGDWRGRRLGEVGTSDPAGIGAWLEDPAVPPPGGESLLMLRDRVGAWLTGCRDAGHTVLVTHPAVIRAALVHVLAADPRAFWRLDISPLSFTDLRHKDRWTVRAVAQPADLVLRNIPTD